MPINGSTIDVNGFKTAQLALLRSSWIEQVLTGRPIASTRGTPRRLRSAPGPQLQPSSAPVVPLLLSAVSLAGVGIFTGLGVSGRTALDRLTTNPCAATRTCDPASVAAIQRSFVAADVALAVGIVAAAGAIWQWWRWGSAPVSLAPALTPQGPGVEAVWRWFDRG